MSFHCRVCWIYHVVVGAVGRRTWIRTKTGRQASQPVVQRPPAGRPAGRPAVSAWPRGRRPPSTRWRREGAWWPGLGGDSARQRPGRAGRAVRVSWPLYRSTPPAWPPTPPPVLYTTPTYVLTSSCEPTSARSTSVIYRLSTVFPVPVWWRHRSARTCSSRRRRTSA